VPEQQRSAPAANNSSAAEADAMSVDIPHHADDMPIPDAVLDGAGTALNSEVAIIDDANGDFDDTGDHSSSDSEDNGRDTPSVRMDTEANGGPATNEGQSSIPPSQSHPTATREGLDKEREKLRDSLVERCLDMIQSHPTAAMDISDLISSVVLQKANDELREEVGSTLASALSSLQADEDGKQPNAPTISAYAHLLALLLQDKSFFKSNLETLADRVDEYIGFLKPVVSGSKEDLPPWIPDILLILEILLSETQLPPEVTWKVPTNDKDPIEELKFSATNRIVNDEQCIQLFDYVLEILPRIGKDKTLAICVLRILVILTRNRSLAESIGDKRNLQRLFVMTKQLAGAGVDCLKDTRVTSCIMNILRHVVEDEETTKNIMRAEITNFFDNPQRSHRNHDIHTYLRTLAPVAFRLPDVFVDVTNDMVKTRWTSSNEGGTRSYTLSLKKPVDDSAPPESQTVEPAKDGASTAVSDIKPSTEEVDKDMTDAPKAGQRPILENPDGVIHFLLTELLNYREVDDTDVLTSAKEGKTAEGAASLDTTQPGSSLAAQNNSEGKDKKNPKPVFKVEEHPIFIYRCFLLHCLSELLHSYNRTKVEFINFKRKLPMQTNTPVKPRSSVLNYLIHDLLCNGNIADNTDTIASKKKTATSSQAQNVLVALVAKTGEKSIDYRNRDKYEYDDEPDLLFVRRFVLDTILKAYERASAPDEPVESRYSKMQSLAELMHHMIGDRDKDHNPSLRTPEMDTRNSSHVAQLRRMMYEKGYLDRLTASIAEIDLGYPEVKRAIKYILRVLRILTSTAKDLSHSNVIPATSLPENGEDENMSASSLSDLDDDREETPDLYRNSALGMLEPRDEDDESDEEDGRP
jgi:E3 ubiquitin-protein ligase HUWE1